MTALSDTTHRTVSTDAGVLRSSGPIASATPQWAKSNPAKGKNAPFASGSPSAGTHGTTIEFSDAPLCFAGRTTTCSKRPPRERCN